MSLILCQITPAFVREAYSLLRQSIIHVEQDDIDFDEEELEGERDDTRRRAGTVDPNNQDAEMTAAELAALEETEQSYGESMGVDRSSSRRLDSPSRVESVAHEAAPAVDAPRKKRMVITHDKYVQLQSLVILHLSQHERETGRGMDRDEMIDWYLESREADIQDVEELEYEKELIVKLLRKLVKVRSCSPSMRVTN